MRHQLHLQIKRHKDTKHCALRPLNPQSRAIKEYNIFFSFLLSITKGIHKFTDKNHSNHTNAVIHHCTFPSALLSSPSQNSSTKVKESAWTDGWVLEVPKKERKEGAHMNDIFYIGSPLLFCLAIFTRPNMHMLLDIQKRRRSILSISENVH